MTKGLTRQEWDVLVVGGGHNGLTAAAYLARAGKSVAVLEARDRLGGACTLERPFADDRYLISPCAYVVGLLDQRVVDELRLSDYGYRVFAADPNLWCPFPDGSSFASFLDRGHTVAYMRDNGFAEQDIAGLLAYEQLFERIRRALRAGTLGDTWLGSSPSRSEIERALEGDSEMISVVFEEPIIETLRRYVSDPRLHHALFGQGVIGVFAGPHDPGTASVKLMHHQGNLLGLGSVWGYVEGGMGQISFAIAQAAKDAGATLATKTPVGRILPGEGVELETGELIRGRTIVSSADPKQTLALLDSASLPTSFRKRLQDWQVDSPVVKLNTALNRIPEFNATGIDPKRAMVTISAGPDEAQQAFESCRRGKPQIGFAELYFQTGYDRSVAPPGKHTMSIFAQYAPYDLAQGDWGSRSDEIADLIFDAIAVYAPSIRDCVEHWQLLGPPDIERRVGLTGGNIFQGSVLPDQMWDRRLDHRTPIDGFYMGGAATHPGGSVIALNGRSAAMAVLEGG